MGRRWKRVSHVFVQQQGHHIDFRAQRQKSETTRLMHEHVRTRYCTEHPLGESNPCLRTENPMSWATRRRGQDGYPKWAHSLLRTPEYTRFAAVFNAPCRCVSCTTCRWCRGRTGLGLCLSGPAALQTGYTRSDELELQYLRREGPGSGRGSVSPASSRASGTSWRKYVSKTWDHTPPCTSRLFQRAPNKA